jgi:hypothetical protein
MTTELETLRCQLRDLRAVQELVLKAKCDEMASLMDELNLVNSDIAAMRPEELKWKRRLHAAKQNTGKGGDTPCSPTPAAQAPQQDTGSPGHDGAAVLLRNASMALLEFNEALSKKR